METVKAFMENIVGAAANDHTALLICQFQDDFRLRNIDCVRRCRLCPAVKGTVHYQIKEQTVPRRSIFGGFLDKLLRKTCFNRDMLQEYLIVKWDVEPLRNRFSNTVSAAAELTADGDNLILYLSFPPYYISFSVLTCSFFILANSFRHSTMHSANANASATGPAAKIPVSPQKREQISIAGI